MSRSMTMFIYILRACLCWCPTASAGWLCETYAMVTAATTRCLLPLLVPQSMSAHSSHVRSSVAGMKQRLHLGYSQL